jgi:hypothetical protein
MLLVFYTIITILLIFLLDKLESTTVKLEKSNYDDLTKIGYMKYLNLYKYASDKVPSLLTKKLYIDIKQPVEFECMVNLTHLDISNTGNVQIKLYGDKFPKLKELTAYKVTIYNFTDLEFLYLTYSKVKNCKFNKLKELIIQEIKGKIFAKNSVRGSFLGADVRFARRCVFNNTRMKKIRCVRADHGRNKNKDFNERGKNKYLAKLLTNYLYW